MFGGAQGFHALHYGFDLATLYLRLDPAESAARAAEVAAQVRVAILAGDRQEAVLFPVLPDGVARAGVRDGAALGSAALAEILEIALPFAPLGLAPGARIAVAVESLRGGVAVERLPRYGYVSLAVPDRDFERVHWRV
jgi:hypothetical protein